MNAALGVGFIGGGPVTQAIHLPALTRLTGLLEVVSVMDTDAAVADSVADRANARATTSVDAILADPAVEVVAVCSPNAFHAEQTIAACRAGKKAVLCEKPLALSVADAEEVARVSRETGVPVVVGTMHEFDAAWRAAREVWGEPSGTVHTVRSSIVLPPNSRMEDFATEVAGRTAPTDPDLSNADGRAALVRRAVLGVAIHNMPHVRAFLPHDGELVVRHAECLPPFGCHVLASYGDCRLEWNCRLYPTWRPDWEFEAFGWTRALQVRFTPSYVQAGSARAVIQTAAGSTIFPASTVNGYVDEWREIGELASGLRPHPDLATAVEDLRFAMAVADAASAFVRWDGGPA